MADSASAAALAARQSRILDELKRIESRLARIAQRLQAATAATPASAKRVAADKIASTSKGPKPAAASSAASPAAASASAAASPPSAALIASINDDDPSRWWEQPDSAAPSGVIPRLTECCAERSITRFRFQRVRPDYYDLSLEERQALLGLPSIVHLCKSVVMVNSRWEAADSAGRLYAANPQFVIVIVSYAEKLHKEKLAKAMWETHVAATAALNDPACASLAKPTEWDTLAAGTDPSRVPLSKKSFNLRLAEESAAIALTGFEHNGMTPIGLKQSGLPMLFASSLLGLQGGSLALGGGEVDVKWRVSIPQFLKAFQPVVADIVG